MSGASNTLAREFLTDVHQLCSAVAQRAEAREEDEEESHMVALGEYLVRGRGFLLLSTLDSIIDQVRLLDAEEFRVSFIFMQLHLLVLVLNLKGMIVSTSSAAANFIYSFQQLCKNTART